MTTSRTIRRFFAVCASVLASVTATAGPGSPAAPFASESIREWGATAPAMALGEAWSLRSGLEAESRHYDAVRRDRRGALRFSLENEDGGFLQGVDLALGIERFAAEWSDEDGAYAEFGLWMASEDLLAEGDWLQLHPGLNLVDGRVSATRYGEAGLDVWYGAALGERVSLEIFGSGWSRRYAGQYDWEEPGASGSALWEWTARGALSLTWSRFFADALALEVRSEFERSSSTGSPGGYTEARAEVALELDF